MRDSMPRFYAAIQEANATAEEVIHTAAVIANPLQILVRRWPAHYPSERLQMELAGKDGVHIVIESSVSDGNESFCHFLGLRSRPGEASSPLPHSILSRLSREAFENILSGPLTPSRSRYCS
jgi:hypothetical protein